MRFFYSRRTIARSELARLTQIDYAREMAFIATRPLAGAPGPAEGTLGVVRAMDTLGTLPAEETLGVARALCDPDNEEAEFAVIVRSDLKGGGLGELLMRKLIAHLRQRGTKRVVGDVLKENARMLELARDLGFSVDSHHGDPDVVRVSLAL
jgi:acetyltransferase